MVFRGYHLVMTNIAMVQMAHRNRWFTVLKNGGSFHGKLLVITRGLATHISGHLHS